MCKINNNGIHHHRTNKTQRNISLSKCMHNVVRKKTATKYKWSSMQNDEAFNFNAVSLQLVYRSQEKLSLYFPLSLSLCLSEYSSILSSSFCTSSLSSSASLYLLFTENKCKHENHLFTFGPHDHRSHHWRGSENSNNFRLVVYLLLSMCNMQWLLIRLLFLLYVLLLLHC